MVKNLPAMQETWVQFLDGKDPLEKEMATQSSILAWRVPWTMEPGRLQSMGFKEPDTTYQLPPVSLSGECPGQRGLVGYSHWGRKESGMTERPNTFTFRQLFNLSEPQSLHL